MPFRGKDAAIEKLRAKGDKLIRGVALGTLTRLVKPTRVKHGRLRNNWNIEIDRPDLSTTDNDSYDKTGGEAIKKGLTVVGRIRIGGSVFITNALPYAKKIIGEDKQIELILPTIRKLMSKVAAKLLRE